MLSSYRCTYFVRKVHHTKWTQYANYGISLNGKKNSWKQHTHIITTCVWFHGNFANKWWESISAILTVCCIMYVYSWIFVKQRSLFLMLGFQKHIKLPTTQHIVVCTLFCKRYFFESQKPPHIWNVLTWYRQRIDTSKKDQRPAFLHYAITKTGG